MTASVSYFVAVVFVGEHQLKKRVRLCLKVDRVYSLRLAKDKDGDCDHSLTRQVGCRY